MTAPERLMTYCGPIDCLPYRVPARNAGLRSRTSSDTRTIASKMKTRHAFHLHGSRYPLHPSRLAPAQPSHRCAAPIETP
jgi:hypothetical protein